MRYHACAKLVPRLGKVLFKVWRSKPLQHEIVDQGSSEAECFVDCLYVENITNKDSSAWFSVVNVNGKKTTDDAGYWCLSKRDILQDLQKVA